MNSDSNGAYGPDNEIVDYILGITHEIWEQGGVHLIDQYYGANSLVYALDGITHGSAEMTAGTNAMLAAFPDRLLLADDVIVAGNTHSGYSSHRVLSPMTNTGDSMFGAATGRQVRIMNMADCVVSDGVITDEWLARDNLALVRQLGFDSITSAAQVRDRQTDELLQWFADERERLAAPAEPIHARIAGIDMQQLLTATWQSGDASAIDASYAEYAVLHRSPVEIISGRAAIARHYGRLRGAFNCANARIDHVAQQPAGNDSQHVALRWAVHGEHVGDYLGVSATGKSVYIMGVTHRRIVAGRVAVEWTVFDSLGVLAQLL